MRITVTGGKGFVGSHVVEIFLGSKPAVSTADALAETGRWYEENRWI